MRKILRFSVATIGLRDESQDLIGGQCDDAKHPLAQHLCVAANADHTSANLVFQSRFHPLHSGAFAETRLNLSALVNSNSHF
jgi:hypothetical protein